jgi:transcriptional regulator GlxA family with amidase domain
MKNVSREGLDWIRKSSREAEIVMSVCMGALLLAQAELLDGVRRPRITGASSG